jgi:hypothetical protein
MSDQYSNTNHSFARVLRQLLLTPLWYVSFLFNRRRQQGDTDIVLQKPQKKSKYVCEIPSDPGEGAFIPWGYHPQSID